MLFSPTGIIVSQLIFLTHLCVVGAHGSRAALRAPRVALMRVRVGVVLHLIVPGLYMVGRRAVPIRKETQLFNMIMSITPLLKQGAVMA